MSKKFTVQLSPIEHSDEEHINGRLLEILDVFKKGSDTITSISESRYLKKDKFHHYKYSITISTSKDHDIKSFIIKYTEHFDFGDISLI